MTYPRRMRLTRLLALGVVVLLSAACTPGSYPIDFFNEMHYQQSQRRLEPNRLSPAQGAVPVTGAQAPLTFEAAGSLQNPLPRNQTTTDRGREVFNTNCAVCHGGDGHGQSVVTGYFQKAGFVGPVDFSGQRARSRSDGELFWIVTYGLGNMPRFGEILSEQDRWAAVSIIREVQGR